MNAALAITPSIFDFKAANDATHNIRTVNQDGEVWFIAKDVFETLGVHWGGARSLALIPLAWRMVVKLTTTQKQGVVKLTTPCETQRGYGIQNIHCLNFKAVCKIAFRSNKPEADNFTNWAAEVIETVLKTGKYELTTNRLAYTTKEDRIPLKDAVTRLIAVTKQMNYPQAYELVHKAFGVDSITEIPKDKLHVATMYVNGLVGEYLPYEKPKQIELPKGSKIIDADTLQNIKALATHAICVGAWWNKHGAKAVRALNNNMGAALHDHFGSNLMLGSMIGRERGVEVEYLKSIDWTITASERMERHQERRMQR